MHAYKNELQKKNVFLAKNDGYPRRGRLAPVLEASSGPKSFDQEVGDFLTQLDEDLKDYNDKGKAATPYSDQEVVDFLTQLDEDLKDYNGKGKAATPCSDKEVVDFLTQLDEVLKDYNDKGKAATPCSDNLGIWYDNWSK